MHEPFAHLKWLFIRRAFLVPNLFSVFLIIASFVGLILMIPPTDEPVFLHYTIYFGIDRIGDWLQLFVLPTSGLVIFFINLILSTILYRQHLLLVYFLLYTSAFAQLLIFVATGLLILQNIF